MSQIAVADCLADAGVSYRQGEEAFVGFCYGDSCPGNRALYETGLTGIPITNVNNNCSTGSTALYQARNAIVGGLSECVIALGFEKMAKGSLKSAWTDRESPVMPHLNFMMSEAEFDPKAPVTAQMFGNAGREHMKLYGTAASTFSKIAQKNHAHSKLNPYAQFRKEFSLEQIEGAPMVYAPLTKLGCCPTSEGAAAALVVSGDFVRKHKLEHQAVEIAGMAMATDGPSSFKNMVSENGVSIFPTLQS